MTPPTSARPSALRLSPSQRLPEDLLEVLPSRGWLRAFGNLSDVTLRTIDARDARSGRDHVLRGAVQLVSLDGAVGLPDRAPCILHAVVSRETDAGLETFGGELVSAIVRELDVLVIALDDDAGAHDAPSDATPVAEGPVAEAPGQRAAEAVHEAEAAHVEAPTARAPEAHARATGMTVTPAFGPLPLRPHRRSETATEDAAYPEAGDIVEHFAFGRCEVVESDGDRLHLRLGRDSRIKEIALEMLRISELPAEEGSAARRFKLDRKL